MSFSEARTQYPVCARYAYLNAGTFGPLARATAEAMASAEARDLEHGRGGSEYFDGMLEARERVRAAFARGLGAAPENVALTSSTTEACRIVLAGLDLGPGTEIVTTDCEHFGLLGALAGSPATVKVAAIRDRPADEAFDVVRAAVTPRTRLLALSHVLWSTGHVLPLAELKQATGLPLLVDGAQSVGAMPVDPTPFDYYTVSGQKWLCGPDSTGALYVGDPASLSVALPSYFSQDAYELDGGFEPKPGAARFDPGWLPVSALAGLEAALESHPDWRFERARKIAVLCRERLAERFRVVTEPGHATLVTWEVEDDPEELTAHLFERGVVVRFLHGVPWLRASCGYWNDEDDVDRLVAALAAVEETQPSG